MKFKPTKQFWMDYAIMAILVFLMSFFLTLYADAQDDAAAPQTQEMSWIN